MTDEHIQEPHQDHYPDYSVIPPTGAHGHVQESGIAAVWPYLWSGWAGSNRRPHGPKPCALAAAPHPDFVFGSPV